MFLGHHHDYTKSGHRSESNNKRFKIGNIEKHVMAYHYVALCNGPTRKFGLNDDVREASLNFGELNTSFICGFPPDFAADFAPALVFGFRVVLVAMIVYCLSC